MRVTILYVYGPLVWENGFALASPVPRLRFTFVQSPFPRGTAFYVCVLRLRFTFWLRSTVYGHGLLVTVTLHAFTRLRLRSRSSLYKPNTTVLRYYICNQKILTMTSTHDTTIEMLNDLYLIVAGTDLSNSKINKTAIFAYLYQQIELQENLAEIEMDYWNSRD